MLRIRVVTRAALVSMLLAAGLSATACGIGGGSSGGGGDGGGGSRASKAPTSLPSDLPTKKAAGGGKLPRNFPVPPGGKVGNVLKSDEQTVGTITITDSGRAYRYWVKALPKHGYTVVSKQSFGAASEIRFKGHGCGGNSQLAMNGKNATVQCDRA